MKNFLINHAFSIMGILIIFLAVTISINTNDPLAGIVGIAFGGGFVWLEYNASQ